MTSLRPLSRPVVRQQGTDVGDATVKALLDGGRSDPNAWRSKSRRRPLSRGCLAGIAAGIDGVRPAAIRRGTRRAAAGRPGHGANRRGTKRHASWYMGIDHHAYRIPDGAQRVEQIDVPSRGRRSPTKATSTLVLPGGTADPDPLRTDEGAVVQRGRDLGAGARPGPDDEPPRSPGTRPAQPSGPPYRALVEGSRW